MAKAYIKKDDAKKKINSHQFLFKSKLDELVEYGKMGESFIVFEDEDTGYFVQYRLDDNEELILDFVTSSKIKKSHLREIEVLLKELYFRKMPNNTLDLEEKQFTIDYEQLIANCGKDANLVASVTDKIFQNIFKSSKGYSIKTEIDGKSIDDFEDSETSKEDGNGKQRNISWSLWIILGIVSIVIIVWVIPDNENKQSEELGTEGSRIGTDLQESAEVSNIEKESQTEPVSAESWKLVTVDRWYSISLNESYYTSPSRTAVDQEWYHEGKHYYPLLVYNYDGELCKNDPVNYTESEREFVVRCPYPWENPERIHLRKGDFLIVRTDDNCRESNLTNCWNGRTDLQEVLLALINETTENRTYKVT